MRLQKKINNIFITHLILTMTTILLLAASGKATQVVSNDNIEQFAALPSDSESAGVEEDTDSEPGSDENQTESESQSEAEEIKIEPPTEDSEINIPAPLQTAGSPTNNVTLSLDKVPINDVIKMFTRVSGANIVSSIESEKLVTVSMYDVAWKEALSVVLESADLSLIERKPGIYAVISEEELAKEPLIVDSYQLEFLTTSDVLPVANKMLISTNAVVESAPGNIVMIKETVDQIENIKNTLKTIDKPVPQVFIEAKFIEMNESAIKDLGINWQALQGYTVSAGNLQWDYLKENATERRQSDLDQRFDNRSNTDTLTELYDMNSDQYEEKDTEFLEQPPESGNFIADTDLVPTREVEDVIERGRNRTSDRAREVTETITEAQSAILSADQFSLTLSALKQNDGVDIISNPKIVVASDETATIHVGQKDPEIRAVADDNLGGRLTYERDGWIESGVRLQVTPTVNTEDVITLLIQPSLSRVIGHTESSGDVNTRIPILSTREIDTKFNVKSGQTAAIGGLTETRNDESVNKIPILGDIPIIGKYLFSHTHEEKKQDEVVIFVTVDMAPPDVVNDEDGIPTNARLAREQLRRSRLERAKQKEQDERE